MDTIFSPKPYENVEDLVSDALESLERVKAAWNNEYRDAARITLKHTVILISGGMSWGDGPTETFNDIALVQSIGALQAAGFERS